jgi:hypothetical protein
MVEEILTDSIRQLVILLATQALVGIDQTDPVLQDAVAELQSLLSMFYGTDTVVVARRAYPSRSHRLSDDASLDRARALYRDPRFAPRVCDNSSCGKTYTGPSCYCSLECAMRDA